jgi:uncharacterized protein
MGIKVDLLQLEGRYGIARLPSDAPLPGWMHGAGFTSFSRNDEEVSIVCLQERIPEDAEVDRDWTCFKSLGSVSLEQAGFVLSIIRPLSENGIGIFVISTFRGDHFMIKDFHVRHARSFLQAAGHTCRR